MRTELVKKRVLIVVPTEVGYQYDDSSPGEPHYVEWHGHIASGESEHEARTKLGLMIGGGILAEDCEPADEKEQ